MRKKATAPAPDLGGLQWDDEMEDSAWRRSRIPEADEKSMPAAEGALSAWLDLPRRRRADPLDAPAHALYDAAFGLLASPEGRLALACFGANSALDLDDADALRGFMALGASFEPATASNDPHSPYVESWRGSILHDCADRRRWDCLGALLATPAALADITLCEPLFSPPRPSPLRGAEAQLAALMAAAAGHPNPSEPAETGSNPSGAGEIARLGDSLVGFLLEAVAGEGERLGLSLAVADLLRGNPLFCALRHAQREQASWNQRPPEADEQALAAADALAAAGLWNPASPSYRAALASMCSPEAPAVCSWATIRGVSPLDAGPERLGDIEREAARHGLRSGTPFADFCAPWTSQPNFPDRLLCGLIAQCENATWTSARGAAAKRPIDRAEREAAWVFAAIQALASRWAKSPADGSIPPASPEALSRARSAIDQIAVSALDADSPRPPWAEAARAAGDALSQLTLPGKPSLRI